MSRKPRRARILNLEADRYSHAAREILARIGDLDEGVRGRDDLLARIAAYDIVITRLGYMIDAEVLERATRLRAIISATTGLDHIDTGAAAARGVELLSLRGEIEFLRSIPATAEHTWALLLALMRRVPTAAGSVLAGRWQRDDYRGRELCGRRLGLLGVGRVGERVGSYGAAFGMRVLGYDPAPHRRVEEVEYCATMEELLDSADVLTLHVPLSDETIGLVGASELARLPRNAVLVNTARGDVLDEEALLDALRSGELAGAALDVVAGEASRGGPSRRLLEYAAGHDNLLITPHIGGATDESMAATEVFMARKLERWWTGAAG